MVWSADIGATHEPPSNIVMKGQKWFVADNMTTTLINIEGEVRALFTVHLILRCMFLLSI